MIIGKDITIPISSIWQPISCANSTLDDGEVVLIFSDPKISLAIYNVEQNDFAVFNSCTNGHACCCYQCFGKPTFFYSIPKIKKSDIITKKIYHAFDDFTYKKRLYRNVPVSLKLKIFKRDKFKCVTCSRSPAIDEYVQLQIDHIIPFSKGGEDKFENLQTLCKECNREKSNR